MSRTNSLLIDGIKRRRGARNAAADVLTNIIHRENPAAGKLRGMDNFVVHSGLRTGTINLLALLPLTFHGFPFVPCGFGIEKMHLPKRYAAYHLDMRRSHPDCSDTESSDRSSPGDILLREEPDEEEDEEEEDDKDKDKEDEDDDDTTDDGYSE